MIGILLLSHISSFFCSFFRRSTARGEYVWRSLANGTLKDNLFVFFSFSFSFCFEFVSSLLSHSSVFSGSLAHPCLIIVSLSCFLSYYLWFEVCLSVFYYIFCPFSTLCCFIYLYCFFLFLSSCLSSYCLLFLVCCSISYSIYRPFPRTLPPHLSLPIHHLIVISISILSHLSPHHHIYPLIVFCFNSPVQFPIISITRFLSLPSPSSSFAFVLLFCVFGWPLTFDGVTLPCLRLGAR